MADLADDDVDTFSATWSALAARDRRRLRRIVRMGQALDGGERSLAASYARWQQQRLWMRSFWVWFAPGLFLALAAASRLHPLAIGVVLALGGQAWFARRNLRRAAAYAPAD